MSETDSFIDEVTEEVQRDKLFGLLRRYGWIGIAVVVLLVGGAAYNEWSKAKATAQAEALGDALLAAESVEAVEARVAALEEVPAAGGASVLPVLLAAAQEGAEAPRLLALLADDPAMAPLYPDLAALKLVMVDDEMTVAQKRTRLEGLLGGAYRTLAEEQLALLDIEAGDREAALARLQALLVDDGASQLLRQRASQLIVALGGALDSAQG